MGIAVAGVRLWLLSTLNSMMVDAPELWNDDVDCCSTVEASTAS